MLALGLRSGFVDVADSDLKNHSGTPVPLGGIGVFLGVHIGLAAIGHFTWALFAGTLFVMIVGLVDDRRPLAPGIRLVGVAVAGLLMGAMAPNRDLFQVLVMAMAVIIVVNAVNLIDGLDGLVAGVGGVSALGLVGFAAMRSVESAWSAGVLASALLGFYIWNRPPARMYLGDNGAYVVGATLVWFALEPVGSTADAVVGLSLVGVPVIDLAATVFRRFRSRSRLFAGDRDHSYDRLHDSGLSVSKVVAVFVSVQAVWVVSALGMVQWLAPAAAATTLVVIALCVAVLVGWRAVESEAGVS